jgi:hypothetical protein
VAISDVQQDLINVGTISRKDVATIDFENGSTAVSQTFWDGSRGDAQYLGVAFQADPNNVGNANPALIDFGLVPSSNPASTIFTEATIVAYDPKFVVLESQGDFYMIANSPTLLSATDSSLFPITDFGTTGPYTPPAVVCFVAGTRIRTDRGETAVEDLVEGDRVCVHGGEPGATRPVIWIGQRDISLAAQVADPFEAQPIRIRRNAFADGMPHRDLLVSPCHGVWVDGRLIPAGLLVNDATIIRETGLPKVRYYHVELDRHAILYSENLPTESYLDTGNRSFFQNNAVVHLNAGLAGNRSSVGRESHSCAPFVDAPAEVLPIWDRLANRAVHLGFEVPEIRTTTEPAPRLAVNDREIAPVAVNGDTYTFALPAGQRDVRLLSRAARPCAARPWISDERILGVSVSRIRVRDGLDVVDLPIDGPALAHGWWAVEQDGSRVSRWTDGDALLRLPEASGLRVLELTIGNGMTYPLQGVMGSRRPKVVAAAA